MPYSNTQSGTASDRFTVRGDGVELACVASGPTDAPTLVFVHGYPDTHRVWDRLVAELEDGFRCVRYDVRGAGASDRPRARSAYRLRHLSRDLQAVMDTVSPTAPVHVIGHDWGSIQAWEAATDPMLAERIAGFTSISGPCLDHVGQNLRRRRSAPAGIGRQLRRSWYIGAFHLPLLPELIWYTVAPRLWPHALARLEGERLDVQPTLARDGATGVRLYRANMLRRLLRPRARRARVPVQAIVPLRDAFIGPELVTGLAAHVDGLSVETIDAGHWGICTHAPEVAACLRAFVTADRTTSDGPAPAQAQARSSFGTHTISAEEQP